MAAEDEIRWVHLPVDGKAGGASAEVVVRDSLAVISAHGEFDLSTRDVLVDALDWACAQGVDIVFDAGDVEFLDAFSLGLILRAERLLTPAGHSVRLLNAKTLIETACRAAGTEHLLDTPPT